MAIRTRFLDFEFEYLWFYYTLIQSNMQYNKILLSTYEFLILQSLVLKSSRRAMHVKSDNYLKVKKDKGCFIPSY